MVEIKNTKLGKVKIIQHQNNVHIYYSRHGKILRYPTGVAWKERNKKKDIVASYEANVSNIIYEYKKTKNQDPSVEYVKNKLKEKQLKQTDIFIEHFEDFFNWKKDTVRKSSLKDYTSFRNSILDYEKLNGIKLTFDSITEDFGESYYKFLTSTDRPEGAKSNGGLNDYTVTKRITSFRAYLKWLERKDLFVFPKNIKTFLPTEKYSNTIIALTLDELSKLYRLETFPDGTNIENRLEKVKDVFIFMSMTSLRYSDIVTLKLEHIDDSYFLEKKSIKGRKEETYKVQLNSTAIEIYEKYNKKLPVLSNQRFNLYLKEICEKSELFNEEVKKVIRRNNQPVEIWKAKWEFLSSHTARRSFITNNIAKGITIDKLMAMTSHVKIDTLVKYIDKGKKDYNITENIAL